VQAMRFLTTRTHGNIVPTPRMMRGKGRWSF